MGDSNMKNFLILLTTSTLALMSASSFAAKSSITWLHPDKYSDIQANGTSSKIRFRKHLFKSIDTFFDKYTQKHLPKDFQLKLTVTNLDLAGYIDFHNTQLIRVIRDVDIPRINFQYQLEQGNKTLSSGKVKLKDLDFLQKNNYKFRNTSFFYEKQLLKDWFKKTILPLTGSV